MKYLFLLIPLAAVAPQSTAERAWRITRHACAVGLAAANWLPGWIERGMPPLKGKSPEDVLQWVQRQLHA